MPAFNFAYEWCVVILVYNEEATIEEVVRRTIKTMDSISSNYSLLIVNDGSRDNTSAILQEFSKQDKRIRVLTHAVNQGIGAALHTGLTQADAENVFWMCSDLQFAPEDIRLFANLAGQYDVILGTRLKRQDNAYRKFISWGYHLLMKGLFNISFSDMNWVQIYKGWLLKSIKLECRSTQITTEIILKAKRLNARITELPTPHYPRTKGTPKGARPGYIMEISSQMLKLWFKTKVTGG